MATKVPPKYHKIFVAKHPIFPIKQVYPVLHIRKPSLCQTENLLKAGEGGGFGMKNLGFLPLHSVLLVDFGACSETPWEVFHRPRCTHPSPDAANAAY